MSKLKYNKEKEYNLDKQDINIYDPKKIKYLNDLINDAGYSPFINEEFCIFKSIDNILYLIYVNKKNSIVSFNIIDNKKINEIKNAHDNYISNIKYIMDTTNKKELIISISNDIKLWNIKTIECLLMIKPAKENLKKDIFIGCFLKNNKHIYIVLKSIAFFVFKEPIKVFNLKGKKVKEINNSKKEQTYYLDNYYDEKINKHYIIAAGVQNIKSYKFDENVIYKTYCFKNSKNFVHFGFIINNDVLIIIGASLDGVYLWNFHSGVLLNLIKNKNKNYISFSGICPWNDEYFFSACNNDIELIKIDNNQKMIPICKLTGHINKIKYVKKIIHPKYGECLISQDIKGIIKLWVNNNN